MYYPDEIKTKIRFIEERKHQLEVLNKKMLHEKEEEKRRYFMSVRWDILKKIKNDLFEINCAKVRKTKLT